MKKIRLLKPLPGAEVGEEIELNENNAIPLASYLEFVGNVQHLIEQGWAEEVKEEEVWVPNEGDEYVQIHSTGIFLKATRTSGNDEQYEQMSKYGLIVKTEKEAKKRLLFLELSNSNGGFIPKEGEEYFAFCTLDLIVDKYSVAEPRITNGVALGNCYKDEATAKKYAHKWKEYFDLLTQCSTK